MIYRSGRLQLEGIREVFRGEVNDVIICRDRKAVSEIYYTLLIIRDHQTVKKLLQIYDEAGEGCRDSLVETFSEGQQFYAVFEYRMERPLERFYMEGKHSLPICEEICRNLVISCIDCGLPYPLLYLVLTQNQIHIAADNSIYFGYQFQLEELDCFRGEADCAGKCAALSAALLEKKQAGKSAVYQLLQKRSLRGDYQTLAELYRDIRLAAFSDEAGFYIRFGRIIKRYGDILFDILLALCAAMGITALLMIISQMIFGDIPFMRIFVNTFQQIGTESLYQ